MESPPGTYSKTLCCSPFTAKRCYCMKIVLDNHGRIELLEHCQGNENYARRFEIELFCNGKSVSSAGYLTSDVAMYEEKLVKQIEEMIANYYFLCVDEKTKLDWE